MSDVPDLSHQRIIRAFERGGFRIIRQGKHVAMYRQERNVMAIIPRHTPVRRRTLARILREIDMSTEEFRALL